MVNIPIKTRLPCEAWAFAAAMVLLSFASSLTSGLVESHNAAFGTGLSSGDRTHQKKYGRGDIAQERAAFRNLKRRMLLIPSGVTSPVWMRPRRRPTR